MSLDMVSPATRLLEKRRVMYEVQKAFEDQKEDYKKEEERCRQREQELKEKDTLIQDNLIRFSTFLQQQEQRKKKDEDLAKGELLKLEDKRKEIEKQKDRRTNLKLLNDCIEAKITGLQTYDDFLGSFIQSFQDEFQEPNDVVIRSQILRKNCLLLVTENDDQSSKLNNITAELRDFIEAQNNKKVFMGGEIARKQKELEQLDGEKEILISSNEENSTAKMSQICEHGQILMTINNLYHKVSRKENWQIVEMIKKDVDTEPPERQTSFDDIDVVVEKALDQLKQIERFTNSYHQLNTRIMNLKNENKSSQQKKIAPKAE